MKANCLILFLSCFLAHNGNHTIAATWYVSLEAGTGDRSGTSWENAFTNVNAIVWSKIQPGDTVEIAKGDYRPASLEVGVSGTQDAPVTVRLAKDTSKVGHVYMASVGGGSRNWVTISGALDDSFHIPQSVNNIMQITNNIGIHLLNPFNPGIFSSGATGQRFLWMEINDCGRSNSRNVNGVQFNGTVHQTEVGFVWIHDQVKGDGINIVTNEDAGWGDLTIHHSIVQNIGDDAIQAPGGGVDIYYCFIEKLTRGIAVGHPDALQTWNNYYRIHHNIFGDFQSDPPGYASYSYSQFSLPVVGNFLLYNNLCLNQNLNGSKGFGLTFDAWFSPDKYNQNVVVTNILIANNLFHTPQMQALAFSLAFKSDAARGTNDSYTFKNCAVYNNTFVDCFVNQPKNGVVLGTVSAIPGQIEVSYESFPLDHNIICGPNTRFGYISTTVWPNSLALNNGSPFKNNSMAQPAFRNYRFGAPPYDFRLTATDNVARGKGRNLSYLVGSVPMIEIDFDGNTRPASGAWDIGPYQFDLSNRPSPPRGGRISP